MELWDLYTKDRRLTGKTHERGVPIEKGYYHLAVHVWIVNRQGLLLLSQRVESRPTFPLLWECVAGSVVKGEDSLRGAIRETKEEVGIDLDESNGKVVLTKTRERDIMDVWFFKYDGKVDLKNATTDEVAQTKWVTKEDLEELRKDGKLVPTLSYIFDLI